MRQDDFREQVFLDGTIDEDSWYPGAWTAEHRETTLELGAAEAVADEFLEVLRPWGVSGPACSQHHQPISH